MNDQALIDAVLLCAEKMDSVSITITALWGISVAMITFWRVPK